MCSNDLTNTEGGFSLIDQHVEKLLVGDAALYSRRFISLGKVTWLATVNCIGDCQRGARGTRIFEGLLELSKHVLDNHKHVGLLGKLKVTLVGLDVELSDL